MEKLKGIDVSRFQGNIDWNKVKNDGIQFAILKFGNIADSDPLYVDTNFEKNYNECKKLGIPVGIYVYNYCNKVENLQRETKKLVELIKGKEFPVGVYLDMEDGTIQPESKDNLTKQVNDFYEIVTSAGHKAGLYTSLSWTRTEYHINEFNPNMLIWIAQYNNECTYKGHYDMWQYTSSGSVNGINGRVDMNISYFDIEKPEPKPENTNTLQWQKVMNKVYGCGILEDNKFENYSEKCAMKHYLYYKLPTIKNDYVGFVQDLLIAKGYDCGKWGRDNSYGLATRSAVERFQQDNGLKIDGYVGSSTIQALLK